MKSINPMGACMVSTMGTLGEYFFKAYVWMESCSEEFSSTLKIKLRLTQKNESSLLIKTWKEDLDSGDNPLTLAISIGSIKERHCLKLTSVYPEKIEGRYLYLSARVNRLGEIWSVT